MPEHDLGALGSFPTGDVGHVGPIACSPIERLLCRKVRQSLESVGEPLVERFDLPGTDELNRYVAVGPELSGPFELDGHRLDINEDRPDRFADVSRRRVDDEVRREGDMSRPDGSRESRALFEGRRDGDDSMGSRRRVG